MWILRYIIFILVRIHSAIFGIVYETGVYWQDFSLLHIHSDSFLVRIDFGDPCIGLKYLRVSPWLNFVSQFSARDFVDRCCCTTKSCAHDNNMMMTTSSSLPELPVP